MTSLRPLPRSLVRIIVWVVAEALLSFLGLDEYADMGEWVFERNQGAGVEQVSVVKG